jgi:hypothetical protein
MARRQIDLSAPVGIRPREGEEISFEEPLDVPSVVSPKQELAEKVALADVRAQEQIREQERMTGRRQALEQRETFQALKDIRSSKERGEFLSSLPTQQAMGLFNQLTPEEQRAITGSRRTEEEALFAQPATQPSVGPGAPGGFVQKPFVSPRRGRLITQTPFRPETLEEIKRGVGEEFTGRIGLQQAAEQRADVEASYLTKVSQNLEAMENERKAIAAQRGQMVRDDVDRMRQTINSVKAGVIDPGRFYRNQTTGSKIAMGLSLAFGAAGASLTGGPNPGMQIIMSSIEDDIQSQIATRDTRLEAISGQRGLLGVMMNHFNDAEQAENATRLAYLQRVETDLTAIAAGTKSQEAKANAQVLLGQLQQQIGDIQAKFEGSTRRKVVGGGLTPEEKARNEANKVFLVEQAKAAGKAAGAGAAIGGIEGVSDINLNKLSDRLLREKIPALQVDINNIERVLQPFDEDAPIPGLGFFERAIPTPVLGALSELGVEVGEQIESRQTFQALQNTLIRINAGLNQTAKEEERSVKEIQGAKDEKSLKRSGRRIIAKFGNQKEAVFLPIGGANTAAAQEIQRRLTGGSGAPGQGFDLGEPL